MSRKLSPGDLCGLKTTQATSGLSEVGLDLSVIYDRALRGNITLIESPRLSVLNRDGSSEG